MASSAAPYGAIPVGTLSGVPWEGHVRHYPIATSYGTNIFRGDFVKAVNDGTIAKDTSATTLTPVGIFVGCQYTDPGSNQLWQSNYWPASTAASDAVAFVVDDPDVVFQMQADGSLAATARFNNCGTAYTSGNTAVGGMSKNALSATSIVTTSTNTGIRIIGFVDGPDSAVGDSFTDALCIFQPGSHEWVTATGI